MPWSTTGNIRGPSGAGFAGTFNVRDYGATGDGTTSDQTAIQNAVAAALAAPGGTIYFPPGVYATTAPIDVPENVTLLGAHGDTIIYAGSAAAPCLIRPLASHSGTAVIRLRGKADSGRSYDHVGVRIGNITIDGVNAPAGTRGIQCIGLVRECRFEYVTVRNTPDTGFWFGVGTNSASPQSFRLIGCLADGCQNNGYTFTNTPDSTVIDCNSLGAKNTGFYIAGFMNGQFANCRTEWSGQTGYYVTSGYWGTGQGSGGCNFLACTSDRSGYNGVYVDATGSAPLQFTNCTHRRDGRNNGSGGGGYAGMFVSTSATMPVVVDNIQVYPGVDDDGTQTLSPQIGVSATGTNTVSLTSGCIHAATTPISAGSGCSVSTMITTATGTTGAPVRTLPAVQDQDGCISDSYRYGVPVSSMPRRLVLQAPTLSNGISTYSGTIAVRPGPATKLRVAQSGLGANTNSGTTTATLAFAVYVGTGANAALTGTLTQIATATISGLSTTAGLKELTLSSTVTIRPGDYVFVGMLPTNYTTNPTFGGVTPQAPAATTAAKWVSYTASGQTTLPTTIVPNSVANAWAYDLWWELAP